MGPGRACRRRGSRRFRPPVTASARHIASPLPSAGPSSAATASCWMTRAPCAAATAAVPSREPASMTTSSSTRPASSAGASVRSSTAAIVSAHSRTGMITVVSRPRLSSRSRSSGERLGAEPPRRPPAGHGALGRRPLAGPDQGSHRVRVHPYMMLTSRRRRPAVPRPRRERETAPTGPCARRSPASPGQGPHFGLWTASRWYIGAFTRFPGPCTQRLALSCRTAG